MSPKISIEIEIPSGMDSISLDNLAGVEFGVILDGVPPEGAVPLILIVAESLTQKLVADHLQGENPLEPPALVEAATLLNARLRVVDEMLHLPMKPLNMMQSSF